MPSTRFADTMLSRRSGRDSGVTDLVFKVSHGAIPPGAVLAGRVPPENRRPVQEPEQYMRISHLSQLIAVILICLMGPGTASAKDWFPFPVYEVSPPFKADGKRTDRTYVAYTSPPSRKWNICVSIPHLKDAYWLAANFGLVNEAKRLGVSLTLFQAGGYDKLDTQIRQIEKCLQAGADALIVSAVSLSGLNETLAEVHSKGIPIIDLINGMSFPDIAARAAADYYDNGFEAGRYIARLNETGERPVSVLWFPGPKDAAWAQRGDLGFNDALKGTNIRILATKYGDTGKKIQGELVEQAMDEHPDVDYIVGTTVTAEAAAALVRRRRLTDRTQVMAYYFGPGVHRGLKRGTIIAAPTDMPAIMARVSVNQAVRILEKQPYLKHVGSKTIVVDKSNLRSFDLTTSLAPRGFQPIFDVN